MPKREPNSCALEQVRRAIEADAPELLEPLLKKEVPVDQKIGDGPGTTLMAIAIEKNAVKVARLLVAAGAKLDKSRDKPLIYASLFNRPEIVELLLKAGADPNVTVSNPDEDVRGETALMYAVDQPEKFRIIDLLLTYGADPKRANSKGETALNHAVEHENLKAVRRFLDAGCKPSGVVLHGLIFRCTRDSLEIMKLLIAAGADLNAQGTRESHFWGYTALEAAKGSYKEKAELIDQLSRRRREGWEEETLERWKAEAQIFQAMIVALETEA